MSDRTISSFFTPSNNTTKQNTVKPQGTTSNCDNDEEVESNDVHVATDNSVNIIPRDYFPNSGWKEQHVYSVFKDKIDELEGKEQQDFVTEKRETMRLHYKELKMLAKDEVHQILTIEILKLQIASPSGSIKTVQEFTTFVNFFMKTACGPNEVRAFFKTFLFPVQYSSFDFNTGWHKKLVEEFMKKNKLIFADKKHYNGNSLRTLCTQEKNIAIKNKNRQMKQYTGMFINLTKPKPYDGKDRAKGVWNDYFVKWEGKDKGITLEAAWENARNGQWNVDPKTGNKIYDDEAIKVIRESCGNNGWDCRLLSDTKKVKKGEKDWKAMVNTVLYLYITYYNFD